MAATEEILSGLESAPPAPALAPAALAPAPAPLSRQVSGVRSVAGSLAPLFKIDGIVVTKIELYTSLDAPLMPANQWFEPAEILINLNEEQEQRIKNGRLLFLTNNATTKNITIAGLNSLFDIPDGSPKFPNPNDYAQIYMLKRNSPN